MDGNLRYIKYRHVLLTLVSILLIIKMFTEKKSSQQKKNIFNRFRNMCFFNIKHDVSNFDMYRL